MTKKTLFLLTALLFFDALLWAQIIATSDQAQLAYYQFDVGQGDSTLLRLSDDVEILYDAGPSGNIASVLEGVLGPFNRRLEVVIISHPQKDHYAGLLSVLEKFEVGLFVTNGRLPVGKDLVWEEILHRLEEKQVPHLTLVAGDKITYQSSTLEVLWPNTSWQQSGEVNDTSLVIKAHLGSDSVLLAGDIGTLAEDELIEKAGDKLRSSILKIPHHGSRFSTSASFLEVVNPQFATVSAGKNNSHGHPHSDVLKRLEDKKISVWRTDLSGGVRVEMVDGGLFVYEGF